MAWQFAGQFGDLHPEVLGVASQRRWRKGRSKMALDAWSEGLVEAEIGVQLLGDALIHHKHGQEQRQVWGDAEFVVAHDVHDVVDGRPEGNFVDGVTAVT